MRKLGALLFLALPVLAQVPVVSGITCDDISTNGGHSSVRCTWNSTPADAVRIQSGATTSYGSILYGYATANPGTYTSGQELILTGQVAGSTIHLVPQSHNASGWSATAGLDQPITFPGLPTPHPKPATLPSTFSIEPDMSGAIPLTANSIAQLNTALTTAVNGQCANKYVITITADLNGFVVPPLSCDIDYVSSVNTTTNTITLATAVNTYHAGEQIRVMISDYLGCCGLPSGLLQGVSYCVTNVSGSTLQLQEWPGCTTVIPLVTAGFGPWFFTPFPPPSTNTIQIRGPASGVPPAGVRPDTSWTATWPKWHFTPPTGAPGSWPLRFEGSNHNFYIGPGLLFDLPNSGQTDTTDPQTYLGWIKLDIAATNIAIKRNVFKGGYPERIFQPIYNGDGSFIDVSDNHWADISYFRPTNNGIVSSGVGTNTIHFTAGGFWTNIGNCPSVAAFTASAPTGSGVAYFTLNPATCLPLATVNSGASVTMSLGTTAVGTTWPRNGNGFYSQALIAAWQFSGGLFTGGYPDSGSPNVFDYQYSQWNGEGPQIATSCGPGPLNVRNNYFEAHGITWHLDDSCSATPTRFPSNVLFRRNRFDAPLKFINKSSANNGASYTNRNQWESKTGQYIWLDGNVFTGEYSNVNSGPSVLINHHNDFCAATPCVGSVDSDFTATNNSMVNNSGCFQLGGGPPNITRVPPLGRRFTLLNNLCANINGYVYNAPQGVGSGRGFCFELSFGGEDVILDHNTCYAIGGNTSVWALPVSKFIEGFSLTNTLAFFNEDQLFHGINVDWGSTATGVPNCAGLTGTLALNCVMTPNYTFLNNIVMNGYLSTATQSGNSTASQVATAYAGLSAYFRGESTVAARIQALKMFNPQTPSTAFTNLRWGPLSPYTAGGGSAATDGSGVGADLDAMQDAQGLIRNVRPLSVASTSFSVDFHSPDLSTNCYVGYGTTTDPSTWATIGPNTQAVHERTIAVTGLTTKTPYYWQVWCAGATSSTTQVTRTP